VKIVSVPKPKAFVMVCVFDVMPTVVPADDPSPLVLPNIRSSQALFDSARTPEEARRAFVAAAGCWAPGIELLRYTTSLAAAAAS
jgi:hypothetical protein